MYQEQRVIARADNNGNLFRLRTTQIEALAKVIKVSTCIHLWHRRLGHRDLKAIKCLIKEELVTGVKVTACFDETVCEYCIKGKLAQTKFPESKRRAKEPVRLIHSDLCGPMQTATPTGNKYFLTLIDDYFCFTIIRLLKDEVPSVIKEYIAEMLVRFGSI